MKVAKEFVDSTLGDRPRIEPMAGSEGFYIFAENSTWEVAAEIANALLEATWAEEQDFLDYLLAHVPRISGTTHYWPGVQVIED